MLNKQLVFFASLPLKNCNFCGLSCIFSFSAKTSRYQSAIMIPKRAKKEKPRRAFLYIFFALSYFLARVRMTSETISAQAATDILPRSPSAR